MHDPLVVALEIRRPWPRRYRHYDAKPGQRRWAIRLHHDCSPACKHSGKIQFPPWRLGSYTPFWMLAGKGFYWPSMVTIWHREPGNHDSGEVCKHYLRHQNPDGTWDTELLHAWRWHVHHWQIQIHALQSLRQRLLTRCAWCHGRDRKGNLVNVSHSWHGSKTPWWRGERGIYHGNCSSVEHAYRMCLCAIPNLESNTNYGECRDCRRFSGNHSPLELSAFRALVAGCRIGEAPTRELITSVQVIWDEVRFRKIS